MGNGFKEEQTMKVPMLPIPVVTSKTQAEKLKQARAEGVAEGKAFSNRQIEMLLNKRVMKPIRMLANKKKRKR